jgi:diaminopimelate epimerase
MNGLKGVKGPGFLSDRGIVRCHLYNAAGNRILWIDGGTSDGEIDFDLLKIDGGRLAQRCQFGQEMAAVIYHASQGRHALFWNPDGSREDLCGNAVRCLPHFLSNGSGPIADVTVRTPGGTYIGRRLDADRGSVIIPARTIRISPKEANGDVVVDVGTRHRIRQVDREWPEEVVLEAMASSRGPGPVNFDLVRQMGPFHFRARIFERGVGETFSCGTGAAAIVAALGTFDADAEDLEPSHLVQFASGEQLTVNYRRSLDAFEVSGRVELLLETSIPANS